MDFGRYSRRPKAMEAKMPPELNLAVAAENRNGEKPVVHALVWRDGKVHPEIWAVGDDEH
jgi:hypothetical protein